MEGEKVMYEYYRRNFSKPHDVAKTEAKTEQIFVLKNFILDELDKLEPEVTNQVNDQNERKKLAAVQNYKSVIRFYKTGTFPQNSDSTGGDVETNDNTLAECLALKAVGGDVCEKVENLNLNEEQIVSGTSKDDLVGKGPSSQNIIRSDEKNNSE